MGDDRIDGCVSVYSQSWGIYHLLTQEKIVGLTRELEEAQKVIAKGEKLEPKLNQRIKELEEEKKDLMVT